MKYYPLPVMSRICRGRFKERGQIQRGRIFSLLKKLSTNIDYYQKSSSAESEIIVHLEEQLKRVLIYVTLLSFVTLL